MTDKEIPQEEYDNGSSLEKNIEQLDKDDPQYADKREKLIEKLQELHKKLSKQHKQIKKQRQEISQILSNLRIKATKNPEDDKLKQLITDTENDKSFLTRATTEIVSLKGNWNNEMEKLMGSKNFNLPLDIKAVTDAQLKPLPSSEFTRKKEQNQEVLRKKDTKNEISPRKHKVSALSPAARIVQLRQTTAERTTPRKTKVQQHTR